MAEKDNTFQNTVEALFRGMDSFITTKTVVGEAIHIDDTILLPLVDEMCIRDRSRAEGTPDRVWSGTERTVCGTWI